MRFQAVQTVNSECVSVFSLSKQHVCALDELTAHLLLAATNNPVSG